MSTPGMSSPHTMGPPDMPHAVLRGRHALVTGASRGIGAAIARRLAHAGATVSLLGRDRAALETQAAQLGSAAGQVLVCDVADSGAVQDACAALPTVHILVNNAGQAESAPLVRTSDELWARMLAVNLSGTFYCTRALVPGMLSAGWGRVVNVASTAALRGYAYTAAYSAAKHGVLGLTRALAQEVASKGVTVNAVCPGFTETDLLAESVAHIVQRTGRSQEEARRSLAALNPQGRFITPDDVATAVLWLVGPGSDAVTGVALPVSGGEVG
jgi:NAD(P)-dependent dehydrogenase (short-subunit alcohol dehydrogenase family)